jgi:hypothetical protein
MLSSDIGQAHCITARYCHDNIPTEVYREAARRALRGRSGAKAAPNEGGRTPAFPRKANIGLKTKAGPGLDFQAGRRSEIKRIGAGEGNRTLVISLEGFCSTIELHPRDAHTQRDAHTI